VVALAALLWWGWNQPVFRSWQAEASPVPFFVAMALLPAIGIPVTPFFVLAGAAFGPRIGLVGSILALAANLVLCHWIGRRKLRAWLTRGFSRFGYALPDFDARKQGALRYTLLVKFMPGIPGFARNYLLATAGVPFSLYFVVSMAITGAYGAALVILGESAFRHDGPHMVVAAVLIGLAVTGTWTWRRRQSGLSTARHPHQSFQR
jgi:uncharacterized membrane protein YdjX (TVP38/TMEM64 family)